MTDKVSSKLPCSNSDEELSGILEGLLQLGFRVVVYPDDQSNFYINGNPMTTLFIDLDRKMRARWNKERRSWILERSKARSFKESVDVECAIMEMPPIDRTEIERQLTDLCKKHQIKFYVDDDNAGFMFEELDNHLSGVRRYGTQLDPACQSWFVPRMRDYHLLCELMKDVKYHSSSIHVLGKSI
jgi:hypothetical protein